MLNENIKNLRKAKGLSQEQLALRLHVVRQTVSKWEKGLSVPDSDMLISLAEELDTSVCVLLGETVRESDPDEQGEMKLKEISERLEDINLQLAKRSRAKVRIIRILLASICVIVFLLFIALTAINGEYLSWDYNNPELAAAGTLLHGFEFVFVRLAPFIFIGSLTGLVLTYKKR